MGLSLFLLFFGSGFCALLYQIVWLRLAFSHFGVITPVLSVVVSVFMLGLSVGSWLAAKWAKRLKDKSVYAYAACEALIGIGALWVPYAFAWSDARLLSQGSFDSGAYLWTSAMIITGSLLPWCLAMGATLPFIMEFIQRQHPQEKTAFSYLYIANVAGAAVGTLLSACVLVELLGFHRTACLAAAINGMLALGAIALGRAGLPPFVEYEAPVIPKSEARTTPALYALILFLSGLTSMGLEVVWTRMFALTLRSSIYAFAFILFFYLVATCAGSMVYRWRLKCGRLNSVAALCAFSAVTVLLPTVSSDPRWSLNGALQLASIVPFCFGLGYLTPMVMDALSQGDADRAGTGYALNLLGCVAGPLVAGYWLLVQFDTKMMVTLIAVVWWILVVMQSRTWSGVLRWTVAPAALTAILAVHVHSWDMENWAKHTSPSCQIRRDRTATVIAWGDAMSKQLIVNNMGLTALTPITKVMAHLPLALHDGPPHSALMICFGMGTTFRSLLSWNIHVTAVELVPSVVQSFGYYFHDAEARRRDPNGRIIVDDGRRFLRRTDERYDVVTLDPPPPVEAAASSLLYSEEFYALVKAHLAPGGVVQQWFPFGEKKIRQALVRSLADSFRYVKIYRSISGWGYHLIGSDSPIPALTPKQFLERLPLTARKDLMEWFPDDAPQAVADRIFWHEVDPQAILTEGPAVRVTDDRPYNEYYFLRRLRDRLAHRYVVVH